MFKSSRAFVAVVFLVMLGPAPPGTGATGN